MTEREKVFKELEKLDKKALRNLSQNFLVDTSIPKRIVENISARKGSEILEMGPGLGVLTKELLDNNYKIKAIELDRDLSLYLEKKFRMYIKNDLEIVCGDALDFLKRTDLSKDLNIVSNLPFNISSAFMGILLDSVDLSKGTSIFSEAIIMLQKEFAKRLTAPPGGKDYGSISVMFNVKMDHVILFEVDREKFFPKPSVDTILLKFFPKKRPKIIPQNDLLFRSIVQTVFMNRRKKMKNSIHKMDNYMGINNKHIDNILEEMKISDMRPEQISQWIFVELSNRLLESAG